MFVNGCFELFNFRYSRTLMTRVRVNGKSPKSGVKGRGGISKGIPLYIYFWGVIKI